MLREHEVEGSNPFTPTMLRFASANLFFAVFDKNLAILSPGPLCGIFIMTEVVYGGPGMYRKNVVMHEKGKCNGFY